jgi:hypothetical protein
MPVPLPRQQREEVVDSHVHPPLARVGGGAALRDHHADERVIVAGFGVRLFDPAGEILSGAVLHLHDQTLTVDAETADVAAILNAPFHSAVDAVIVERVGEVVGGGALGAGAGRAGCWF